MTNKEKMLNGEYYISWDQQLTDEREAAKDRLFEFNAIRPSLRAEREAIIHKLFSKVGKNCWIESPFNCDYGYNIEVGDNFYANSNCCILDCGRVVFGNNVWIGPNVGFYTPEHAFDNEERSAGYEQSLPIQVGDNVWIGGGVSILSGVTIGSNCIIGAGSVVTKNIPDNSLVVGNPARVLRQITEQDKIGLLKNA
ncbi:sugar O-acetyltransferase [Catenovulum sp. 2E275]|uniref:sugar O-acetyltransferase n=1 Tax=Catenovulum sp. 2E275 TaxID=2980497 RepID=UPI00292A53A7|nr:sugar O-acetyltransferase [Catenovulum sp. 2E275]